MRMSYEFEGQSFPTLAAWARAYPAYRSYEELIRDHRPPTIMALEKLIQARAATGRAKSIAYARAGVYSAAHAQLAVAGKERRER